MYYHRYLSLFVLEEFPGVVRDTARNLRVLDLCGKYAVNEQDRLVLEQYRPYITMMHVRARASLLFKEKRYTDAMDAVKEGLRAIKEFFIRFGQEDAYAHSNEVKVLKKFVREIRGGGQRIVRMNADRGEDRRVFFRELRRASAALQARADRNDPRHARLRRAG